MKKSIAILLLVTILFTITLTSANYAQADYDDYLEPIMARAQIIDLLYEGETVFGISYQIFAAEIRSGPFRGEIVRVENNFSGDPLWDMVINPGDRLILAMFVIDDQIVEAYPQSFDRVLHISLLVGMFVLVLLVLGKFTGLKSIAALGFTIFLIVSVMLPAILRGHDPLILAIIISAIVTALTLLLICGFTTKTFAAIIGTVGGVLVAAVISIWVGHAAALTGLDTREALWLFSVADVDINFRNLLFAGIIIGALGAVMDVAISIASAMEEVKVNNPSISNAKLIKSGMNVGKDIMGTMTNTLILAYTGASLPMILWLFYNPNLTYMEIINSGEIATEFVRALSGSIGLVFAIPITAIAWILLTKISSSRKGSSEKCLVINK